MSWSSKPQAQVWQTKSFASAIRGAAASGPPPGLGPSPNGLQSLHSVQQQSKPTEILNLTHNHFQQKLSQANISSHVSLLLSLFYPRIFNEFRDHIFYFS